jgi:hypothetical protein
VHAILHRTSGPFTEPAPEGSVLRMRQLGGPVGLTIRFAPGPAADPSAFEVTRERDLTEPAATPVAASVLTFTGPLSDAVLHAAERASRERIGPALEGHPGGVRVIELWQPELRRKMIITLATSIASLEEGGRVISSLALLPGEDEALLPGPDHVETFRVELCRLAPPVSR